MTNGIISFGKPICCFTATALKDGNDLRFIAPFWADVDSRDATSNVYYRQTTNSTVLYQVSKDVKLKFPTFINFKATWTFVVTWHDVTHYDQGTKVCEKNTFYHVMCGKIPFLR